MHRSCCTCDHCRIYAVVRCSDDRVDSRRHGDDWAGSGNGNFCLFADCAGIGGRPSLPDGWMRSLDSDAYCSIHYLDIEWGCCRSFRRMVVVDHLVSMVCSRWLDLLGPSIGQRPINYKSMEIDYFLFI